MAGMRLPCAPLVFALLMPAIAQAADYADSGTADLGTLERGAVDAALTTRGLAIDPVPAGKVIGAVEVVNLDVFQPSDGRLLTWFNHFHRTTREEHIRRESLLRPGMPYDAALVDETVRNLRNRNSYSSGDAPLSSIVAVVPVKAATPGTVDVLMVTRDVWSLRFNTDGLFGLMTADLATFSASLSENNLLGWRKQAALVFQMDQGEMQLGPNYVDPNVLGSHLRLTFAAYQIWQREIGKIAAGPAEGAASLLRLEYPLYALSQHWGGFVEGSYKTYVNRDIVGPTAARSSPALARFDPASSTCIAPAAPGDALYDSLTADCAYRRRFGTVTSGVRRSFPSLWLIQRVTIGNEFATDRPSNLPGFPVDQDLRARFAARYFGFSERSSALYVQYDAFTPRYRIYRDLDTFDLREDMQLGPSLTLKSGRASTLLGSEADFFPLGAKAQLHLAPLDSFQSISVSWEGRAYGTRMQDQLVKGQVYAATPVLARRLRVVASATAAVVADNVHRARSYVGWSEGLRGYPIGTFYGYDYYVAHLEVRSMAFSLASLRVGGLLFADAGNAADTVRGLTLYDTAGIGLRVLIPQLNADVLRCDWGFPLRDNVRDQTVVVRAGWPGAAYCGFGQAF